jgi:uncharacterized membrane protein
MKYENPKRSMSQNKDFGYLENRLQISLKPVSPRPDFVRDLKQQLTGQFEKLPSLSQISRSNVLLMAIALMVCVFMVIFLSIRAAATLISAFTLLYQYRRQAQEGHTRHLNPGN